MSLFSYRCGIINYRRNLVKRGLVMMIEKRFLTLDNQILKLEKKNVHVPKTRHSLQQLRDSNYINLVSCSKVKFAIGCNKNGKYVYSPSHFREWIKYYRQDCSASNHLNKTLLEFEKVINSRTAYYVSELLEKNELSKAAREELIQTIRGADKYSKYNGERTWSVIAHKTFGELRYIIKWLWRNGYREIVKDIFESYDFFNTHLLSKLDEIVNLRNNNSHFRPLNVYLVYGSRTNNYSNYNFRVEIIKEVFYQRPNKRVKEELVDIFHSTKRFNSIKKPPNFIGRKTL